MSRGRDQDNEFEEDINGIETHDRSSSLVDALDPEISESGPNLSTKEEELIEYRSLIRFLERKHRSALAEHLIVASRLRFVLLARDPVISHHFLPREWTLWPLEPDRLPRLASSIPDLAQSFDYSDSDLLSISDEDKDSYDLYRLPSHKLFVPPSYSQPLMAELSALAARVLSTGPSDPASAGDDLEDVLYPFLHAPVLSFLDNLLAALISIRASISTARRKRSTYLLSSIDWLSLLDSAALVGFPALEPIWDTVLERTRKRATSLFPEHTLTAASRSRVYTKIPSKIDKWKPQRPGHIIRTSTSARRNLRRNILPLPDQTTGISQLPPVSLDHNHMHSPSPSLTEPSDQGEIM
ncbi:uncharacterized protein V1516DRAFT_665877 [Lipomyces oligophaga]|uniref:uncharacterized protein n=1 Tax=Lipomyces oligophaga TaxID=45792 RepID=UPI0034CE103D